MLIRSITAAMRTRTDITVGIKSGVDRQSGGKDINDNHWRETVRVNKPSRHPHALTTVINPDAKNPIRYEFILRIQTLFEQAERLPIAVR